MKNVIVKVYNTKEQIAEATVITKDGKPTIIQAGEKVNYEFFDESIGRGPNHIITKRVGDDLHVSFEREGKETDLIIEGFYLYDEQALIGLHESDEYYYYIPDTGEVYDYVTQLEVGAVEGQALGGEEFVSPLWIAGFPWWLAGAALAAGGIAALVSDDDDDSKLERKDEEAPKPDVVAKEDGSVDITPDTNQDPDVVSTDITYIPEGSNEPKTVTATKGDDGKWTVDDPALSIDPETGVVTIPEDKVADGTEVTAVSKDKAGNTGDDKDTTSMDGFVSIDDFDSSNTGLQDLVSEGDTISLPITLKDKNGNDLQAKEDLEVTITYGGKAEQGKDFIGESTVLIKEGESTVDLELKIKTDDDKEGLEDLTVMISNPTNGGFSSVIVDTKAGDYADLVIQDTII